MKVKLMELKKNKSKKGKEYYTADLYCSSRGQGFAQQVFITQEQYSSLNSKVGADVSNMIDVCYREGNGLSLYFI